MNRSDLEELGRHVEWTPFSERQVDLATERERQLTTARANQTTGLTNGKAANWAPEVAFSFFRALSCRQLTRFSGQISHRRDQQDDKCPRNALGDGHA